MGWMVLWGLPPIGGEVCSALCRNDVGFGAGIFVALANQSLGFTTSVAAFWWRSLICSSLGALLRRCVGFGPSGMRPTGAIFYHLAP